MSTCEVSKCFCNRCQWNETAWVWFKQRNYNWQSKPFIVGILHRLSDKIDFAICIAQILFSSIHSRSKNITSLRTFIKNLLFKSKENSFQRDASCKKNYLEFCFSNSLEQIITSLTRNTDRTATFIDYVLTKFFS